MGEQLRIALEGTTGRLVNYGVEGIIRGTAELLRHHFPDQPVVFVSYSPDEDRQYLSGSSIEVVGHPPRHPLVTRIHNGLRRRVIGPSLWGTPANYRLLRSFDWVLSIGGDIFTLSPEERDARYFPVADHVMRVIDGGAKVVLWGASVGPFEQNPLALKTFSEALQRMKLIVVREHVTEEYLATLGIADNVRFAADPAYLMPAAPESDAPARDYLRPGRRTIAVNFSPLSVHVSSLAATEESVPLTQTHELIALMDSEDVDVLLVPHVMAAGGINDDHGYLSLVQQHLPQRLRDRTRLLPRDLGAQRTKRYISHCDALVAARMHCAIAGLSMQVPTLLLSYSPKARGMCRYVYGDDQWVQPVDAPVGELTSLTRCLLKDADRVRNQLAERQSEIRADALRAGEHLKEVFARIRSDAVAIESRGHRSAMTYSSNLLFTLVTLVLGLFATPRILHWLGEERLGAFRAATDWAGYLALLELGLGGALPPLLARARVRGDVELRRTLAAGFRAYTRVACLMLVVAAFLPIVITRLVPVRPELAMDLKLGAVLAAAGALLVALAPLRSLMDATQRGYVVNIMLTIQSVSIIALSMIFARAGFGIAGQFLAVLMGLIIFNAGLWWRANRLYPGLGEQVRGRKTTSPLVEKETSNPSRDLWSLNWPTLLSGLSGRVSYMTDNIVIAYVLGPAAVVPFFLTQRLAQLMQGQIQSIGNATWAAMAELYHSDQRELLNTRLIELTRLVMIIGLSGLVPIFAFNRRFVELWVGHDYYAGVAVSMLAASNALLLSLFSIWGWMFGGTGNVRRVVPVSLTAAGINLVVSVVATIKWGLIGPLLGTTTAVILVHSWCLPVLLRRHFGVSLSALAKAALLPLMLAVPYAIGVRYLALLRPRYGWVELMMSMAACGLVYLVIAIFLLISPAERAVWLQRVRKLSGAGNRQTAPQLASSDATANLGVGTVDP